jgi:hypothetical protein
MRRRSTYIPIEKRAPPLRLSRPVHNRIVVNCSQCIIINNNQSTHTTTMSWRRLWGRWELPGDAFEAANEGSMTHRADCGKSSDAIIAASCISCCTRVHARIFFFEFGTFLGAWFSAPFAGIHTIICTHGSAHGVTSGAISTMAHDR